jgi:hypothetical protein
MSVHLLDVLQENGLGPESVLRDHPGFAVASITAAFARKCGQGIARNPLRDDPAHAEVFGQKPKAIRQRLAKGAVWAIPPAAAEA